MQRILVVEDEKKLAELMCRALRAQCYLVEAAHDGNTAWEMIERLGYGLVVLDLMLPGMSGEDVVRRVRRRNDSVPILIVSAHNATDNRIRILESGADDYLAKPFAIAELIVRVKALMRRGPISRSSVVRVGDLQIDRSTRQVHRAGQKIELTMKEYALLEYLASNPGCIFSRATIIEHVWDQSFEGLPNIVDVYVRHLRGKVDDPFPTKLIQTARGAGYYICDSGP